MSDERTEKATTKRREESRKKGQVSKSQDLNSAVTLFMSLGILFAYAPFIFNKFQTVMTTSLGTLDPHAITNESFLGFLSSYILDVLLILVPIMAVMFIAGIVTNVMQIGLMISFEAIKPDLTKLSPAKILKGFKKFFELKSIVELLKSLMKTAIIFGVGYSVIMSHKAEMLSLIGVDLSYGLVFLAKVIFEMVFQICIVLLILGIIDRKYQDYEYEKSIKMTKQEIKDERKNIEGDPKIKAQIRGRQMQFATQRMMSSVPTADVVVTNPTHFAIAIRYDMSKSVAPQVVAKGADYVAFKIREVAEANNVPIIENPPLARTLYKIVPLEGMIPAELYVAVAEVLALVYKTNKGKGN